MTTLEAYETILLPIKRLYEEANDMGRTVVNQGNRAKTADILMTKVRSLLEYYDTLRLMDILWIGLDYYQGTQYGDYILSILYELTKKKNHDYGDAYYELHKLMPEGIKIRLFDKASRLVSLCADKEYVDDERWTDTLDDLINYCLLELAAVYRDKSEKYGSI